MFTLISKSAQSSCLAAVLLYQTLHETAYFVVVSAVSIYATFESSEIVVVLLCSFDQ